MPIQPPTPIRSVSSTIYGERYRANPKDIDAALAYGQALRANGQRAQAAAVLEQACIANPGNKPLLAGWGRALADNGNFQQAFDVLSRAHTPENPDWRILSVQGTALDQLGRHDEARRYYASALKIVPGEPSVLSNLGMSYMLSKDLPKAEEALRQAYANPGELEGAAESRPRGRAAGPLRRGRADRQGGPAAGRGGRQCRLSARDAEAKDNSRPGRGANTSPSPSSIAPIDYLTRLSDRAPSPGARLSRPGSSSRFGPACA